MKTPGQTRCLEEIKEFHDVEIKAYLSRVVIISSIFIEFCTMKDRNWVDVGVGLPSGISRIEQPFLGNNAARAEYFPCHSER